LQVLSDPGNHVDDAGEDSWLILVRPYFLTPRWLSNYKHCLIYNNILNTFLNGNLYYDLRLRTRWGKKQNTTPKTRTSIITSITDCCDQWSAIRVGGAILNNLIQLRMLLFILLMVPSTIKLSNVRSEQINLEWTGDHRVLRLLDPIHVIGKAQNQPSNNDQ